MHNPTVYATRKPRGITETIVPRNDFVQKKQATRLQMLVINGSFIVVFDFLDDEVVRKE